MKLSKIMKKEIENLCDEYLLEGADTKLDTPSSSSVFIAGVGNTFFYRIKKIASVAACLVLAVAAVITFTLIRNSIENVGDVTEHDPMSNETQPVIEKMTSEEVKEYMAALYTQNNEDIYLLENDKKYERLNVENGYYIGSVRNDSFEETTSDYKYFLTREYFKTPERDHYLCNIAGCQHNSATCMAFMPFKGWDAVALTDKNGNFETYYVSGVMYRSVEIDGVTWINPDYNSYDDNSKYMLFEINLKTGTKKAVAIGLPFSTQAEYYYNGYVLGNYEEWIDLDSEGFDPLHKAISIDTRTGEWKTFDPGIDVEIIDIIDGYVYLLDRDGNLYKATPSLEKIELYKTLEYCNEYDPYDDSKLFIQAEIINDKLYYRSSIEEFVYDEKGLHDFPESVFLSDLYVADLYDDADNGKKLAENILMICESEKYEKLYFTTFELINNGVYKKSDYAFYAKTTCGGTLYCVDTNTNEISTVFEDCGGDVGEINYVSEDMIIFSGTDYKSILEGFEYGDLSVASVYSYDVKTGTVTNLGGYSDYYGVSSVYRLDP